jgi:hypothetical protein
MPEGMKYDTEKPMWNLLDYSFVAGVVDVLTLGAVKYAPNNWQKVKDGEERYFAAMMRHITAWRRGEKYDPESKKHHLYHAACCIMFLLWFDEESDYEEK